MCELISVVLDQRIQTPPRTPRRGRSPMSPHPRLQTSDADRSHPPSPELSPGQLHSPRPRSSSGGVRLGSHSISVSPHYSRTSRNASRYDRSPLRNGREWSRDRRQRSASSSRSRRRDDSRGRSRDEGRNVPRPRLSTPSIIPRARTPSPLKQPSPLPEPHAHSPEERSLGLSPVERDVITPFSFVDDLHAKDKGKMREEVNAYDADGDTQMRELPPSPVSAKEGGSYQSRQRRSRSPPTVPRQYAQTPPSVSSPRPPHPTSALPSKPDWSRRTAPAPPLNTRADPAERSPATQTTPVLPAHNLDLPEYKPKLSVTADIEVEVRRFNSVQSLRPVHTHFSTADYSRTRTSRTPDVRVQHHNKGEEKSAA